MIDGDDHDQKPIDNQVRSFPASAELDAGKLGDGDEDERTDHRAPDRAHAPQGGHETDNNGKHQGKDAVGIDEKDILGVERPADRGEEGAQCQGVEFIFGDIDPQAARALQVSFDGFEIITEFGAVHPIGGQDRQDENPQSDVIVRGLGRVKFQVDQGFGEDG